VGRRLGEGFSRNAELAKTGDDLGSMTERRLVIGPAILPESGL
jgi:hypothetical protein